MRRAADTSEDRGAAGEAAEWLSDYLASKGQVSSTDAKKAGKEAGHTATAIRRASERLHVKVIPHGFPRVTYWEIVP